MKRILILASLLIVASCETTTQTNIYRGKKGLHIDCSGLSSSWNSCLSSAAKACSEKGYRVIAKSGDSSQDPNDYLFGLNPAGYSSRSMIITCR